MARHWYLPIKALKKKINTGIDEHCCHITGQLHVLLNERCTPASAGGP